MHISISPRSGRGFKYLPFLNDTVEWKSRFTLVRNVYKSIDYIKKCFNQKLSKIKFPTKTLLVERICQSPSSGAGALQEFIIFKI